MIMMFALFYHRKRASHSRYIFVLITYIRTHFSFLYDSQLPNASHWYGIDLTIELQSHDTTITMTTS